jgi:hypothetical protein
MISALTSKDTNFDFKMLSPAKKTLKECMEYIAQYFVPLKDGNIAVFEDGKYTLKDDSTVKKVYFNRMPKYESSAEDGGKNSFDFSKWFFNKYTGIRSITYELTKDVFYDDKMNMCPRMKHQYIKFEEFNKKVRTKVKVMLNYIKEVLASGRDDTNTYLLQWLAHMIKGNKNDSILYLKSKQGFGKSTLLEFIRQYVVGEDLALETGSGPILSNFNAILGGKLFVYFEELETFSISQWMSVSSRLKRYATSNTITLEDKNVKAYTATNIMNIIIASNNDAVVDDDGRRYFILDIATHRQVIPNCDNPRNEENIKFWSDVRSCFNDEVGHAFYCYLMEVDTTNYRPQNFPTTQSKLDSYAKRMDSHENFLKYNYVLNRSELKTSLGELYEEYVSYCRGSGISKPYSKVDLGKKLREIGIEPYKSNDKLKIKMSAKELAQIAKNHNWVHEVDEYYDKESKKEKKALPDPTGLDAGMSFEEEVDNEEILKKLTDKEKEVQDLNEQFEKMRLEFEAYKKQFPPPTPPAPPAAPKSPPSILVIEDSDEEESEPEPPKPRPKSKKSILKLIEDSDEEEPDQEEEFVRIKDSKIVDFLEPEQEVSFLE